MDFFKTKECERTRDYSSVEIWSWKIKIILIKGTVCSLELCLSSKSSWGCYTMQQCRSDTKTGILGIPGSPMQPWGIQLG